MYCTKCGSQTREGDLFCWKCGARLYGGEREEAWEADAARENPQPAADAQAIPRRGGAEISPAAVTGLVLGTLALALHWMPFFAIAAAILGIIFIAVGRKSGSRCAKIGLVFSLVGLVAALCVVFVSFHGCAEWLTHLGRRLHLELHLGRP